MIGLEQFAGADTITCSARASTDVLIYAFSAFDFEALVLKYPYARQYVSAYDTVSADYHVLDERREPQTMFLHELAGHKTLHTCRTDSSIREAALKLHVSGVDALAVLDADERPAGVLTADALIAWIATGSGDGDQSVATLLREPPPAIEPVASVADGMLTMAAASGHSLAITSDGTSSGQLHALLSVVAISGAALQRAPPPLRRSLSTDEHRAR